MGKNFVYFILALMFASCSKHDFGIQIPNGYTDGNYSETLGIRYDSNHDWCITTNGNVTIKGIPSGAKKVQVLGYIAESDTTTSMYVLNEKALNGDNLVTLKYDIPSVNKGLYVSLDYDGGNVIKKVNGDNVDMSNANSLRVPMKRVAKRTNGNLVITSTVESYASKRGWIPNEVLYEMSDDAYIAEAQAVDNYDAEYIELFRNVIFSYFKNGKQYNNLPLIKESGYFNEKVYPITTGGDPIVVSPVYKSDKATKYGNEVYNSDLYYYYFKESDLTEYVGNGGTEVDFLKNLPKYKAIKFSNHFGVDEDDVIEKRASYQLIYWGDGTPTIGTEGTYDFPQGYKIGFMVRTKTTADGGKKQGELYGDGRLNNKINFWGNFKSSNLGEDGPRMGWITLNGKMLLCCESGTDSDFNDIILEVEGGVEDIIFIPEFEENMYTFAFEDTENGDYDLNDVVIKATRIDNTTIEYSVVACGAFDEIYIKNINGEKINEDIEVHAMFGKTPNMFINTERGIFYGIVTERITVDENFSFLDEETQPYIYDATTNKVVHLAKRGEDPHGIMIPYDFRYPLEKICVKVAYDEFNIWGANRVASTDWYKRYHEEYVW